MVANQQNRQYNQALFQQLKFKNVEHQLKSMNNNLLTLLALFCLTSALVSAQKNQTLSSFIPMTKPPWM